MTTINPIERPGVDVRQNFVSNTAPVATPELASCAVAPCYRVVDALDANGNPDADARAGSYKNGLGEIAYAFPDFPTGGVLDSDSVKAYLQSGSSVTRLRGVADEIVMQTATGAGRSYVHAGGSDFAARELTLTTGQVQTLGIVAGDAVRVTMPANGPLPADTEVDLIIEEVLSAGNVNTVVKIEESSSWGFDLTASGKTFKLVKDPAQFRVNESATKATLQVMENQSSANQGLYLTAETAGSAGDSIQLTMADDAGVSAGSEEVSITETATGWLVEILYDATNSTWLQVATALRAALVALGDDTPIATLSAPADLCVGDGSTAVVAEASLVAFGDIDGNGVFLFDGGADANTVVVDADLLNIIYSISLSSPVAGYVLLSYLALRVDVTASAAAPALLSFGNKTEMLASIGPEDSRNPLGLMMAKMFDAAPATRQYGLGVSAVSTAHPLGTPAAYTAAFTLLSTKPMHAIGVASQASQVAQLLTAHVQALSAEGQKRERHGFFCRTEITHAADTVILSGVANGEVTDEGTVGGASDGDTLVSGDNMSGEGVTAGDVVVISGQEGPYVLGNGLGGWYVTGSDTDSFVVDDRDVDANNTTTWPQIGEDLTWTVYRPGAAISSSQDKAQAYAEYSYGFAERRVVSVVAPEVTITVGGSQQRLPGSYAVGTLLGLLSRTSPEQPLTEMAFPGIDKVHGTSDTFDNGQLNLIAGGGSFILAQDSDTGPVYCRHQLTTDVSTIERMHLSIQRVLDFITFDLRALLRPMSGKQNITAGYLNALNTQLEGRRGYYIQRGLVADFTPQSVVQSETSPTTTVVDINVGVQYPGDYINTTLNV